MLFNSLHFIVFLPIVVLFYFLLPHRYRWGLLLIASYYFYMSWKPEYAVLLFTSTIVDYWAGLRMDKTEEKQKRKKYLVLSLFVNLGLLFAFKYFNFFSDSIRQLIGYFSLPINTPRLKVLLPVGISFYTFQTLSYTIDVYRQKIKPEKHFGRFAVYVSFFPQLVAGPIERAKNLLPQLKEKHNFDYQKAVYGLKLMLWGFFLKLVIADRLAILVDKVYNNVVGQTGPALLSSSYFFAFQIYADFAGYSLIAIGAASLLGIKLMTNFRRPYFSQSVSEFWKRWHISLSSWFRDYLYIPLGGNRVGANKWLFNILVVFILSGLWHGAGWTFLVWGLLHGFYLISGKLTASARQKLVNWLKLEKLGWFYKLIRVLIVFHLALIGWVFFRANSLSEASYIFTHLFSNWNFNFGVKDLARFLFNNQQLIIGLSAIAFMLTIHFIQEKRGLHYFFNKMPTTIRWLIYLILVLGIILFGVFTKTPFIYFQF